MTTIYENYPDSTSISVEGFSLSPGTTEIDLSNPKDCGGCTSGMCCVSEDPISLSVHDISRLAAYFDITFKEFLETFTQDDFGGDTGGDFRDDIDDPDSSTVTYLRRRDNFRSANCVFLKYHKDDAGVHTKFCSVHNARPYPCREFYWEGCSENDTSELTIAISDGLRGLSKGELTVGIIQGALNELPKELHLNKDSKLADAFKLTVYSDLMRAANHEEANAERMPDASPYQDDVEDKLNRAFSATNVRYEEEGLEPEHHHTYTEGTTFLSSPDHARLLDIARNPVSENDRKYFGFGDYPFNVGWRHFMQPLVLNSPFKRVTIQSDDTLTSSLYSALNFMISFTNRVTLLSNTKSLYTTSVHDELFTFFFNLKATPNFNTDLPEVTAILNHLATKVTEENTFEALDLDSEDVVSEAFESFRRLFFVSTAHSYLNNKVRDAAFSELNKVVDFLAKNNVLAKYMTGDNPVFTCLKTGTDYTEDGLWLDSHSHDGDAWDVWYDRALDPLYLQGLAFLRPDVDWGFDADALMSSNLSDLEYFINNLMEPGMEEHVLNILTHQGYAMSFYGRRGIDLNTDDGNIIVSLTNILVDNILADDNPIDLELLSEVVDSVYGPAGLIKDNRRVKTVCDLIVKGQASDGSWGSDPTLSEAEDQDQEDFLYAAYHTTWTCLDALRFCV